MKNFINLKEKTNVFNKTKIYEKKDSKALPEFDYNNVPKYKIILSQVYANYKTRCEKQNSKPMSFNKMKSEYGLPNNLNNYFFTNPKFDIAFKPTTIHHVNAFKLIFILGMDLDTANLFLESLSHPRLDSKVASDQAKAIHYALRCDFSLEKANEFLIQHNLPELY